VFIPFRTVFRPFSPKSTKPRARFDGGFMPLAELVLVVLVVLLLRERPALERLAGGRPLIEDATRPRPSPQ
jgi:hypothetical protein